MKSIIFIIVITLTASAQLTFDSNKIMDSLLSVIHESKDAKQYGDFKSINIDGGEGFQCDDDLCHDTLTKLTLPAGILISDRKAFLYSYNEKMIEDVNRRLIIAKEMFNNYQNQVNKASDLYTKRIEELEKKNKRSWFERNNIYIGFVIGITTAILIESITIKIVN